MFDLMQTAYGDRDRGGYRDGIPLQRKWRFQIRVGSTWEDVETEPFEFDTRGDYRCQVSLDPESMRDGGVVVRLTCRSLPVD